MKEDECRLLIHIYLQCKQGRADRLTPRQVIVDLSHIIQHKRAFSLLNKWCKKGWYDYGVVLDLGWLTSEGKQKAVEILREEQ